MRGRMEASLSDGCPHMLTHAHVSLRMLKYAYIHTYMLQFERRRVLVRGRKEGLPHTSASKEALLQTTSALLQTTSGSALKT